MNYHDVLSKIWQVLILIREPCRNF